MDACEACRRGPAGIAGHEGLFSHKMDSQKMQFRCRDCGVAWVRRYGVPGEYLWGQPAEEHPGMDTPGRPGTAPP